MKNVHILIFVLIISTFQAAHIFGNIKEIWKVQTDYALRLYKAKKYSEALKIERSALDIAEKTFGKDHLNYISNLNNMGEIYRALKDIDNAKKYFEKAVSIGLRRKSANKDPIIGRYISNLALLFEASEKYDEAEKYQKKVVLFSGEIRGKKSSEYAEALSRLGRILRKLGRFKEAGDILKKALEINIGRRDYKNKNNVFIYSNLGMNSQESGDFEKGEQFLKKAVTLSKVVYGKNAPETARNINNLSALYYKFSRYKEARTLIEKFIKINREQGNQDVKMVSTGMLNLGAIYYAQKIYKSSEKIFFDILRAQEKNLGKNHPAVGRTLRKIGTLYFSWKKYEKSKDFLERSFVINNVPEMPGEKEFFEGKSTLGLAYEKLGLHDKALELYKGAMLLKIKLLGEDSPGILPALNDLGIYYFRTGRELFSIPFKKIGVETIIDTSSGLSALAFIRKSGGLFELSMSIAERFPKKTFPDSLITINYYMEYLILNNRLSEAESLYKKIVLNYKKVFGVSHLNMTNILRQFAKFYKQISNFDKSLEISSQVVDIFEKNGRGRDVVIVESLRE
ncbi:MAG: tetratricopeptide repeat protein, partial [Candidatus Aminicenantes bacterium]|nr:tetratricopeptide repeat protein [Candidatus Aminicenantes bacterium]